HERRADLSGRHQPQRRARHITREQRLSLPQRDRCHLYDELVEQAGIEELAGEVSATHHPDILPTGRLTHLGVHRAYVAVHETDVGTFHGWKLPAGKDPRRLRVRPRRTDFSDHRLGVAQHPFVRRGTHRQGTDVRYEVGVARV